MRKILIPLILVMSISGIFTATVADIDNYWKDYILNVDKITYELKRVRSSSDFELARTRIQEVLKANGLKMISYKFTKEDGNVLAMRYRYHIQYRTEIGLNMMNANKLFYQEYQRIKNISGGEAFLAGILPTPAQAPRQ